MLTWKDHPHQKTVSYTNLLVQQHFAICFVLKTYYAEAHQCWSGWLEMHGDRISKLLQWATLNTIAALLSHGLQTVGQLVSCQCQCLDSIDATGTDITSETSQHEDVGGIQSL